jgi:hypothetical protein
VRSLAGSAWRDAMVDLSRFASGSDVFSASRILAPACLFFRVGEWTDLKNARKSFLEGAGRIIELKNSSITSTNLNFNQRDWARCLSLINMVLGEMETVWD